MSAPIGELTDHDLLVRIATQMQDLAGNGQPGRVSRLESEVHRLDRWRYWMMGAIAAIGVALASGITVFAAVLQGHH